LSVILHQMWLHFVKNFQWTINFLCNKILEKMGGFCLVFFVFVFFFKKDKAHSIH